MSLICVFLPVIVVFRIIKPLRKLGVRREGMSEEIPIPMRRLVMET
jgi:hypothetical protein